MGYDPEMLDEPAPVLELLRRDYICIVCQLILEDPVQLPKCGHIFCRACIKRWLSEESTCPVDRHEIKKKTKLNPPSRIITSMINNLKIRCQFRSKGCTVVRKVEAMDAHEKECGFEEISCKRKCGTTLKRDRTQKHNCVQSILKKLNKDVNKELGRSVFVAQHSLTKNVGSARKMIKRLQTRLRDNLSSLRRVEKALEKRVAVNQNAAVANGGATSRRMVSDEL